jgi:cytochrome c5
MRYAMKSLVVLSVVVLAAATSGCRPQMSDDEVMQRYIAAYNAHDQVAMSQVVADTAKYCHSGDGREPQPLIDKNKEAWEAPATAGLKLTLGSLSGKKVVVGWGKMLLQDGTFTPMTKLIYFELQISKGRVMGATGTMMLYEPDLRDKILAEPPE